MAYEFAALDASLAAIVGDDPALAAELRTALADGARSYSDLLARSRCDANWAVAAHRLKGLAASFGAMDLLQSAEFALESAPGDPVALRRVSISVALLSE
jgi:HPt (histidine-containing phosphotransfer) domain-containing protein